MGALLSRAGQRCWLLLAVGLAAVVSVVIACDRPDTYIYTAQKFDPASGCVGEYEPIEAVNGSGASATCGPTCLSVGEDLYLSNLCPPVPDIAEIVPEDAEACGAAIAAAMKDASCAAATEPEEDAGAEEEAGAPDAGSEDAPVIEDAGGE